MKTKPLFALALSSTLMAAPPVEPKPLVQAVENEPIRPESAICDMLAPVSLIEELKDMEANGDAIESILNNEKAKTTLEKLKAPIVIGSMEDAAKYLTRASIEKIEVDFDKQQLAVFAWQGSGQDKLNGHLSDDKNAAAQFHYRKGMTKDLGTHSAVYSMPKGTKVNVREQRVMRCGVGEMEPQIMPNGDVQIIPLVEGRKVELKLKVPQQKRGE